MLPAEHYLQHLLCPACSWQQMLLLPTAGVGMWAAEISASSQLSLGTALLAAEPP